MKYEMKMGDYGDIILVDSHGEFLLYIWRKHYIIRERWPDGFWLAPDWRDTKERTEANRDYHAHREEYITEAKKLLVKEML